jgi:hypothetical protein
MGLQEDIALLQPHFCKNVEFNTYLVRRSVSAAKYNGKSIFVRIS